MKAQFHWDREGKYDADSSCWIRVATMWAGKQWGVIHIPRIGQEVIVDFLEGDPDQPIIVGSVYNADQMPAFDLPKSAMISGFRSSSTPGGRGYNEFTLNDTKGKEQITVHGQYDMNTTVENNQTTTVHNNRTDKIDVDDSETVGNNQKTAIGVDQTLSVGSNQKITVGAKQDVSIGADLTMSVGAGRAVKVSAADKLSVGGAQTISVTGDVKITSAASITLGVGGSSIKISPSGIDIVSGSPITITGAVVKVNS